MNVRGARDERNGAESPQAPLVSIIIPAFRAVTTLGATVSAALTQTYPNIEIVVVDDGSGDATAAIATAYGDRVRLVDQANSGVSAARNAGAAHARGELLLFCDSDDVLLPPAVESLVDIWRAAGGGRRLVTCNAYPLTGTGIHPGRRLVLHTYPPPSRQRELILRSNFVCTIALFPAEVFDELGGYDDSLRVVEDWDMWLRAIYAGVEILFERRPLALYRWRAGSLSSDSERMLAGEEVMFRRFFERERGRLREHELALLTERLDRGSPFLSRASGDAALLRGEVRAAAREYRRAARLIGDDRRLRLRAWSLTVAPFTAALWRRRDERVSADTGLNLSGPGSAGRSA